MRDNIAKFINNAAMQITGESSNDGLNEYGFYFGKEYVTDSGISIIYYEDGSSKVISPNGYVMANNPPGSSVYGAENGGYVGKENGKILEDRNGNQIFLKE